MPKKQILTFDNRLQRRGLFRRERRFPIKTLTLVLALGATGTLLASRDLPALLLDGFKRVTQLVPAGPVSPAIPPAAR